MDFNTFRDFSKLSVKIRLGRKQYNAIFIEKNNYLMLEVNVINDIEFFEKAKDFYKIVNGQILFNNIDVSLLDCQLYNKAVTQGGKNLNDIKEAYLIYRVDRILLGKRLLQKEMNNILKCEVVYNNIECFSNSYPYKTNYNTLEYSGNLDVFNIYTSRVSISINYGSITEHKDTSLTMKRNTNVVLNFQNKKSIGKSLDEIYKFRNFLVLLLKKHIVVQKQYVYYGDNKCQLFDCNDIILKVNSNELEEHLSHRCIKIEKLNNINEIYKLFEKNYNKLFSLIELYYNVTQISVPNLTRFINAVTMIENMSRNYDYNSAFKLTKKNNNRVKNDADYKYMVYSLIKKVNDVYNLSDQQIEQISDNIKNARVYYIHYKKKSTAKKMSYEEQFRFSYFMQDIVLLNIYKLFKMDIKNIEYLSFNDYYYAVNDLL